MVNAGIYSLPLIEQRVFWPSKLMILRMGKRLRDFFSIAGSSIPLGFAGC